MNVLTGEETQALQLERAGRKSYHVSKVKKRKGGGGKRERKRSARWTALGLIAGISGNPNTQTGNLNTG